MKSAYLRILLIGLGVVLLVAVLLVTIIYLWPVRNSQLQTADAKNLTYEQSVARFNQLTKREPELNVLSECQSLLMTHGSKTAKTVVMLHGLTACPSQFKELAESFYNTGYNVYVPRTPYHGTGDKREHGQVMARDLVDYVNTSVNIATGLGDEIGVVGLSGGGMLATWAAEYRPELSRALIMAPFYEPAASQAPKWQLPFLNVLYGYHILPDTFRDSDGTLLSYRALANYDILTKNLKPDPSGLSLKYLALITSPNDDQIDLDLALSIPRTIAEKNNKLTFIETTLPSDWGVQHDMVSLTNESVREHRDQLYKLFLDSYEGRATKL